MPGAQGTGASIGDGSFDEGTRPGLGLGWRSLGIGYLLRVSERGPDPGTSRTTPDTDPLRRSRTSGAWLAVTALAVLLLLLVIFIAQNTQRVEVSFLGWNGDAPLAVALLIAAIVGIVLAVFAGSLRIVQLRRRVRRERSGT